MKLVKKEESILYVKPEIRFQSNEYETDNPNIDCAVVQISGHYPTDDMYVCNTISTEVIYVLSGDAEFDFYKDKIIKVHDGDVIVINPNERYRICGNASFCIMCNPHWSPEQQMFYK